MRRLLLAPLLILIGSCTNQETSIHKGPPVPAATPALNEDVSLVELDYGRFQILYDCQRGEPHRFTYTATEDRSAIPRVDNFRVDRSLPEGCKGQHSASTYSTTPGFDRGHLAPSNHFDDSIQAMNASNMMTNIVPQLSSHNRVTWYRTETLTECYRDFKPIKVIGGVVFGDMLEDLMNDHFVKSHGVATPEAFWKVLLTTDETDQPTVIAWWIPHKKGLGTNLDPFVRTVREIEVLLGPYEPPINIPEELKDIKPARSWELPTGCDLE